MVSGPQGPAPSLPSQPRPPAAGARSPSSFQDAHPSLLPPPSPIPSPPLDGGFSAFEPLQTAALNSQQHQPSPEEKEEREKEERDAQGAAADEMPSPSPLTPVKRSPTLPPSPSYHSVSFSSETSSPSPSIASFRIAQIVNKRLPAVVAFHPAHLSLSGEQALLRNDRTSRGSRSSGSEQSEEATLWDLRAGRNAAGRGPGGSLQAVERAGGETGRESATAWSVGRDPLIIVEPSSASSSIKGLTVEPILRSESAESFASDSSWKRGLDAAVDSITKSSEMDSTLRPHEDALRRMTSLLGPKVKMISKAPWDLDGTEAPIDPPRRKSEASSRALHPSTTPQLPTKSSKESMRGEDAKLKSSRSRSFSALTSPKGLSEADVRGSEDALRGLGLSAYGSPPNPPRSPGFFPKPQAIVGSSASFLDANGASEGGAATMRKGSAPAALGRSAFSFPPPNQGLPSAFDKSYTTTSRARGSPTPVLFDIIAPGAPLPSPTSLIPPRSAPANIATFSASERASGRSSTMDSLSAYTTLTNPRSPSFPPSPPSPSSSFVPLAGVDETIATTSPGAGYTLISLAAARQRETDRVSAAAAQRQAMLPVEHIAGREEVVRRVGTPQRSRESSGGDLSSASSGKTLKAKKSGFLKRMMGGDRPPVPSMPMERSPEVPVVESFRALPDDYVHSAPFPPPVTISSPHQSVDLKSSVSFKIQPAPPGRANLLKMPSSDQLGARLAPALSLRPVSTFFSPGIAGFLADDTTSHSRNTTSPSTLRGVSPSRSPTTPDFATPIQSPFAPSFHSSTTGSSLFDDGASISSSSVTTPLTPGFSPSISHFHPRPFSPPFSPKALPDPLASSRDGGESVAVGQEQFARAKQTWKKMQWELETHIRTLKAEVERLKEEAKERVKCESCESVEKPVEVSVLARPRFKGAGGGGAIFGSGLDA